MSFLTNLEPKHYTLLSGFVMALGVQISGLEHGWHDALTPSFIGASIIQLAVLVGALGTNAPRTPGKLERMYNA